GAEGVDGPDARDLELGERVVEAAALVVGRGSAGALELGAQAQLHLAGGLVGERDGDEARQRRRAGAHDSDDARDELGGLAGTGGGLDDERGAEVLADAPPRLLVAGRHGDSLSLRRRTSLSGGLRRTRSSPPVPHTAR